MPTYDVFATGALSRLVQPAQISVIAGAVRAVQQNTLPARMPALYRLLLQRLWKWLLGAAAGLVLAFGLVQGFGIDVWPRWNEENAWRELSVVDPDCAQLRAFLNEYPAGRHQPEARIALENPVEESTMMQQFYPLALAGPMLTTDGYATRDAALAAAQDWATGEAVRQCDRHASIQGSRLADAQIGPLNESCDQIGGNWQCAVDGEGTCEVEVAVPTMVCRLDSRLHTAR